MDIVTITDSNLGLSNYPGPHRRRSRKTTRGCWRSRAKSLWPASRRPRTIRPRERRQFAPNWGVPAVPINTPLIFEPPLTSPAGSRKSGSVHRAPYGTSTQLGRGQLVSALGRQRHLFANRGHHVAVAPGGLDRFAAGGGGIGFDRYPRGRSENGLQAGATLMGHRRRRHSRARPLAGRLRTSHSRRRPLQGPRLTI